MAKPARVKTAAATHPVPQSRDQVVDAIAEIGRRQRERDRIKAAMNDEIARIKERFEEQGRPHGEAIKAATAGVQTWCEANRAVITDNGKVKTASFGSGDVRWRITPPSVDARPVAMVIEVLKARGLDRFLRTKEEVNKEAILADPDAITGVPGLAIKQREEFVIVPFETELEEVL